MRGACLTQIVATRIYRPADSKPCDGHTQTRTVRAQLNGPEHIMALCTVWERAVLQRILTSWVSETVSASAEPRVFHCARAVVIPYMLPGVDFHEIRKYSAPLCEDPLCIIVPKSGNKCGDWGVRIYFKYETKLIFMELMIAGQLAIKGRLYRMSWKFHK